jgi:cell wall assembly regulator SMI1
MPETSLAGRDIDTTIARQLEQLRETIRQAAAAEDVDNARRAILRLLDQLLQQPSRAASELVRRRSPRD